MNQRWTLHVENFARIKEANIEISPLICFIGDNNSGKSYMMSLLWGLLVFDDVLYENPILDIPEFIECKKWITNHVGKTIVIDKKTENLYLNFFNKLLELRKNELTKRIFNNKIEIGKIEILKFKRFQKMKVQIKKSIKKAQLGHSINFSFSDDTLAKDKFIIEFPTNNKNLDLDAYIWHATFFITWNLLMFGITKIFPAEEKDFSTVYLPASRTGLLLTYKQIASKSIDMLYSNQSEDKYFKEKLTAPYVQFLQLLINLENPIVPKNEKKENLINFLNQKIVKGTITVKDDGRVICYKSDDMSYEIPMSITSSVVTEIASFLLLLKTKIPVKLIVIEEPEAHLHPALQKKIAQLLIRFVHSGIPIWITTHSETILQHFNNMIKLNNRSEQDREDLLEKFHYTKDDLLNPNEINLYQFTREEKQTLIDPLKSDKYGFVVPSFNKAIDELTQEIFAFQEED